MGLSNVLSIAGSGLRVTQSGLDIVARNVANADTPGYTRKTVGQENLIAGGTSFGARDTAVTRAVDEFLQTQLRIETAAFSDVEVRREFLERLDQLFGEPGADNALDTLFNEFTQSFQELAASPELFSARQSVVGSAEVLSQQLRQLSGQIQALRQLAEDSLQQAVTDINEALSQLGTINESLRIESGGGVPPVDLLDERDKFLDQISQFLEVRVVTAGDGTVSLFTQSGNALLEGAPVQMAFDHHGNVSAHSLYNQDDSLRGVGTVKLLSADGFQVDLIRNGVLNTGRLGALIELRDDILVEAQAQLDEVAHGLATALSSKTVAGAAVNVGTQNGFTIDTNGLLSGNSISLSFTPTPPGTQQNITIVRVDDASLLPLSNDLTANPNDVVIGADFSGGLAAVAAALDTALDGVLGAGVSVAAPGGTLLRVLDDTGVGDTTVIDSLSATMTATALQDDGTQLPLFVDGANAPIAYSASLEAGGQKTGFSARISVNTQISQNNELLVRYATAPETPIGDTARPLELMDRLTTQAFTFSAASGIGQTSNPFTGDIGSFVERVIGVQTGRAADAAREFAAHDVVVSALREKMQETAGVDINEELSALIELQNTYAANARIIQAVEEMLDFLFRAF